MNKHLYRIVFNRVRGALMAVAETVSSTQHGKGRTGERGVSGTFRLRSGAVSVAAVLGAFHLTPYAQIVADPNAGAHRPTIDQAANGTPIVQITAPSAAGVSRNQYQQFNTGPGGAILNNAQTLTQTQLAGYVAGNPNLAGGSARIILNEVTGNQASSLRGYLEVAGQRAQVVIANPNGLVCDGCGVINSDRFTLTTGTPIMGIGGSLDAFRVTGGSIQVQGNGLNASNLDQVDLIARSVQVNGKLWANNANVVAGTNTVNYADLGVQVITSDANRPTVAIDVGNLGGLYAGKIKLIGTESGVGVNSAGTIAAQAGDLAIDSAGRVTLAGTINATGALRVGGAQGVANTGTLYGQQNVELTSGGATTNAGTVAALGNVSVSGQQVQSSGTLAAGVDTNGAAANAGKTLNATATGITSLNGQNFATSDINVSGASVSLAGARMSTGANVNATATQGDIDHTGGNLQAGGSATFNAGGTVRNDGGTVAASLLAVTAGGLSNRGGTLSQSGSGAASVNVSGTIDNTGGKLETAATDAAVTAESLVNDGGTLGHAGNGSLSLHTGALSNANGKLQTNGALDLHATTLANQGGTISAAQDATVRADSALDSTGGTLHADGSLNLKAGTLTNRNGLVSAAGQTTIAVTGALDNTSGRMENAGANASITAGSLTNDGGAVAHAGTGALTVRTGALSNTGGKLQTNGTLDLHTVSGSNHGVISSIGQATIQADQALDNSGGTLRTNASLDLRTGSLVNQHGLVSSAGQSTINVAGALDNTAGRVESAGANALINAGSFTNDGGALAHVGTGALSLQTGALSNAGGTMQTNGTLDLHAASLRNQGGAVSAAAQANVLADETLDNSNGTLRTDGALDLQARTVTNEGGLVSAGGQATVAATHVLDNTAGRIESGGADATITAASLTNDGGTLAHIGAGTFNVQTGMLSNASGKVQTNGALDLQATSFGNQAGTVWASGPATVRIAQALNNNGGTLQTRSKLDLLAISLSNQQGLVSSAGRSTINVMGALDNTGGRMESGGADATVNAGSLTNNGGELAHVGSGTLNVQTGTLSNAGGKLQTNGALNLQSAALGNQAGTISAAGAATVHVDQAVDSTGGVLQTGGALDLRAASLNNQHGLVSAAGQSNVNITGALDNTRGRMESAGTDASLHAATLTNDGGAIAHIGTGTLSVQAGAISNTGGALQTNGTLDLQAGPIGNRSGVISSGAAATVQATQALDNTGGTLRSSGTLGLNAASLVNRDGVVSAAGQTDINVEGTLNNTAGLVQSAGSNANVTAAALTNDGGALVHAGTGQFKVQAGALSNVNGKLQTNGTLDLHAASLANHGGTVSAIGQATVRADADLDNTAGTLSADTLQATAGGALTNDGGLIDGSHGTTVSANTVSNAGGTVQNLGTEALTVSATQTLSNTARGLIAGNGQVTVAAGNVDNSGGTVSSGDMLAVQSANSVVNRGGTLSANRAVQARATGALDNTGGRIEANGVTATLDVKAASIDNTGGRLSNAGTGGTNVDGGAQILNSNAGGVAGMGTLGGNGAVTLTAHRLTNTAGGQVLAGRALDLNIDQSLSNAGGKLVGSTGLTLNQAGTALNNTDGAIQASGNIVLNVATLDNTRGQIGNTARSGGNVQAAMAGVLTNTGGRILSDGNLSLNAQTVGGAGRIVAGQDAAIALQGDYTNVAGNVIQANRDLAFNTTGTFSNEGELLAVRNLTAGATHIVNAGHFNADTTTLSAAGIIANSGRLEGNTVNTTSDTLANTGTIIGNAVTLSARQISNDGAAAIAAAVDTLNVYARQSLTNTNGATLYSLGNMNIAADGMRDGNGRLVNKTQSVVNEGSTIEADQNLEVAAADVQNRRANVQFTTDPVSSTEEVKKKREKYWFCANGYGYAMARGCGAAYQTTNLTVSDGGPTTVTTNIPGSFVPDSGWQTQDTVYPAVRSVDTVAKKINFADGTSIYYESISQAPGANGTTNYTINYYDGGYNPNVNINPLDERPYYVPWSDHVHMEYERHTTTTITQDRLLSATPEGRMLAGNNMLFADGMRLSNNYSTVAAGNVMQFGAAVQAGGVADGSTIGTSVISNVGSTFGRTTTVSEWSLYRHDDDYNETSQLAQPTRVTSEVTGELRGTISAGTRLTGSVGSLTNTNVSAANSSVAGGGNTLGANAGTTAPSGSAAGGASMTGGGAGSIGMSGAPGNTVGMSGGSGSAVGMNGTGSGALGMNGGTAGNVNAGGVHFTVGTPSNPLPNFSLPTNGLFHINPAPGPGYLVESDPRFTNRDRFISSDYMLGRLGIDPATTQKRLGDGFYEQKLVNDQITQLTGRRYLQGYASAEEEYRALMESGANVAKSFSLVPGMALTDTQIAALTQDIVWMVEQTVKLPDGTTTKVLAPVVYLARTRADDLKPSGALITADAIDLHAAGDLTNSGRIAGGTRVNLAGDNIVNPGGTIDSAGTTVISAATDVVNASGIISGNAVGVAAGRDIRNVTLVDVDGARAQAGASTSTNSLIGQTGAITSRGDLAMSAGRDVVMSGATLSAKGDASLSAGRDLTVDTVKASTTTGYYYDAQTRQSTQDTTHLTSSVNMGGNVSMASGRDTTLVGAQVKAGGDITAVAQGNLNIRNATDTSSMDYVNTRDSNHVHTASRLDEATVGSNVSAGGNVTLAAVKPSAGGAARTDGGGNVSIIGSSITAGAAQPDTAEKSLASDTPTVPGRMTIMPVDLSKTKAKAPSTGGITIVADRDVTIGEAREVHDSARFDFDASKGLLSSKSSKSSDRLHLDVGSSSTVSGDTMRVQAGNDLTVRNSAVVGTGDVSLAAGNNVLVTAGQNVRDESHSLEQKQSGFGGTGGIGFSYGRNSAKGNSELHAVTQSDARSTVGSTAGNVAISAGKDAAIVGSDVIAGSKPGSAGSIDVRAQNIRVEAGQDHVQSSAAQETSSSGISIGLVGTPLDTVRNLRDAQHDQSKVTRARNTLNEIGASALDTPQVAISFGSSRSSSQSSSESLTNHASQLTAGGDIRLRATGDGSTDAAGRANNGDITITGSTLSAGGTAALDAQRDVLLQASTDTYNESSSASSSGWRFSTAAPSLGDLGRHVGGGPNNSGVGMVPYGSNRSADNVSGDSTSQNASVILGKNVQVQARTGDITVAGSGISALSGVDLLAKQGKVDIVAGTDTANRHEDHSSRQIGDLGGTGTSGSVGVRSTSSTLDTAKTQQSTIRSQVSSLGGDVNIVARDDITVRGGDLSAGGDLKLTGRNLNLDAGQDNERTRETQSSSQYGVTLALSGYAVTAAQSVEQAARAVEQHKDPRVAALYLAQAALTTYNGIQADAAMRNAIAGKAAEDAAGNIASTAMGPSNIPGPATQTQATSTSSAIKATVSIGGGSQQSESNASATANKGSTLKAGQNVVLTATGQDATGTVVDGDITARGTSIVGQNVTLNAARDIDLESRQDITHQDSKSSGSNASIGVGFGLGGTQNGFTIELAAGANRAHANGDSVTQVNTTVTAADSLSLNAGRDANLRG
ncbi:hemagglutinin repeat-containing protein, partial [Ralstonia mojiangensis]|uniref:hemagglutinin repeat-containing protein n=1 Tax=Ralstonia mojiangensis TaxID=2953895 RepID=UPI0021B2FE9F